MVDAREVVSLELIRLIISIGGYIFSRFKIPRFIRPSVIAVGILAVLAGRRTRPLRLTYDFEYVGHAWIRGKMNMNYIKVQKIGTFLLADSLKCLKILTSD